MFCFGSWVTPESWYRGGCLLELPCLMLTHCLCCQFCLGRSFLCPTAERRHGAVSAAELGEPGTKTQNTAILVQNHGWILYPSFSLGMCERHHFVLRHFRLSLPSRSQYQGAVGLGSCICTLPEGADTWEHVWSRVASPTAS